MLTVSRVLCCASLGAALLAPSVASAAPVDVVATAAAASKTRIKLKSIGSPPRVAAPGSSFTLKGRVTNTRRNTQRATVRITLRRTKGAFPKRVGLKTLARIRAGRTLNFSVKVSLPRNLAEGTLLRARAAPTTGAGHRSRTRRRLAASRRDASRCARPRRRPRPPARQPAGTGHDTPAGTPPAPAPTGHRRPSRSTSSSSRIATTRRHAPASQRSGRLPAPAAARRVHRQRAGARRRAGGVHGHALDDYRAVVFLNTGAASGLNAAQQAAFETYYRRGGGFFGIGSAIETDPDWQFLTDALGTRATTTAGGAQSATIKVADRVHEASADLPEYWEHSDVYYNFTSNVRGLSHVLATVVEKPFEPQPAGNTLNGISAGTMGADHPVLWCKDYQGGRSFYSALGTAQSAFGEADFRQMLKGAIDWTAGVADRVTSDCGATVWANYQQVKVSGNTPHPATCWSPSASTSSPTGGSSRRRARGQVRLHNPATGTTQVLANFADPALPTTMRLYTNSEDGLYGPAIDNNFAQNKWVYLYYSPQTVTNVKLSDGSVVTQTTPNEAVPNFAASPTAWDPYVGYFQLSRFKFVEDAQRPAHLDLGSEQQILRVSNNRQECCHVAGDIDFDKHNNLWMVTGDDTPAGGIRANGYGPFEDELTDEQQTVRITNATGGTFTLTFNGQTTAPIAYNATAGADRRGARGAARTSAPTTSRPAAARVEHRERQRVLPPGAGRDQPEPDHRERVRPDRHDADGDGDDPVGEQRDTPTGGRDPATPTGGMYQRPTGDDRRTTLNTNDLRGKMLRIKVKDTHHRGRARTRPTSARAPARTRSRPGTCTRSWPAHRRPRTRPEVYAMGFRNPFRLSGRRERRRVHDRLLAGRADARSAAAGRPASAGSRSSGIRPTTAIRSATRASSATTAGTSRSSPAGTTTVGHPAGQPAAADRLRRRPRSSTTRAGSRNGGPGFEPGLRNTPPVTDPEIWYSYRDNTPAAPLGHAVLRLLRDDPGADRAGLDDRVPAALPGALHGRRGSAGHLEVPLRAGQPEHDEVPAVLRRLGHLRRVHAGHDARGQARLAEPRVQDQQLPALRAGEHRRLDVPFECDNPMDMQWGADGSLYLLTYGDGFFTANADAGLYKFNYVKGQRAPTAVLSADRTDGPAPLTVKFSSAGSNTPEPSESITYSWDFGDGTPRRSIRTRPTPTPPRAVHGGVDRHVLVGQVRPGERHDHGGQHVADGDRADAGRRRHVRLRRHDPLHGDGHRPGGRDVRLQPGRR